MYADKQKSPPANIFAPELRKFFKEEELVCVCVAFVTYCTAGNQSLGVLEKKHGFSYLCILEVTLLLVDC